jgi:hypothetical protein
MFKMSILFEEEDAGTIVRVASVKKKPRAARGASEYGEAVMSASSVARLASFASGGRITRNPRSLRRRENDAGTGTYSDGLGC